MSVVHLYSEATFKSVIRRITTCVLRNAKNNIPNQQSGSKKKMKNLHYFMVQTRNNTLFSLFVLYYFSEFEDSYMEMKENYKRIISAFLAMLFLMMVYGLAKSIIFLDYAMGYYGENQEFCQLLLSNDKFIIGFTSGGLVLCIFYALCDFISFKKKDFLQFICSILLLLIATYLFILVVGVRKQAFSLDGYSTNSAFSLYTEYRSFSLMIIFSEFLLSLQALFRSIYTAYQKRKKTKN